MLPCRARSGWIDVDKPERIYGWLNSQLSIARHYGGCSYNGAYYFVAYAEEGQPLVREDVLKREKRAEKPRPAPKLDL